ncbi:anti-sigma factor [Phenylobacterium sp.]|uniref:anti-sigma factor n=1 Tax=Phenylobacterium sp. TaxID=1871053 RepID=UPI002DE94061|nr:anti-sigma factor [Phenylobacterium sp.]
MSQGPDLLPEDEALAAEHALGVLSGPERAAAEVRMARDPAFAAQVEAWRARLAPLLDGVAPVAPPADGWSRIERALPANDDRAVRVWRRTTLGALSLAAASLALTVVLATRPPVVLSPAAPAPILNASLTGQADGAPLFVAAYDPARKALIVTSLVQPGKDPVHVHELWLIPADGRPRALGYIAPGTSKSMPMPAPMLPLIRQGAAIAVSVEPPGGSTKPDGPSGPIAALGKLSQI